jgi:hypothetical protein
MISFLTSGVQPLELRIWFTALGHHHARPWIVSITKYEVSPFQHAISSGISIQVFTCWYTHCTCFVVLQSLDEP